MATINEENTKPDVRYVKPDLLKGDFAAGGRTMPPTLTVEDFASGEHTLPTPPEDPDVVPIPPVVPVALDHEE